jgi:CDGSH-type Zn-finger protein
MTEKLAPRITACPGGPLLVRGRVDIVGDDGTVIRNPRRTVALCRCGASAIKPWCDGTHKLIRFTTAEQPPVDDDDAAPRPSGP